MAYTTINKSSDYFNTKLYTGTGSSNTITGVGFQPDWVWIKARNYNDDHRIVDAVRGVTKDIYSNLNLAEGTNTNGLTAFGSDGFTVGSDGGYNGNSDTYASWNWKANGAGSSNTDGSITSTVSANTTSGFSIVSYTGTGANATVGHGLGSNASMVIIKNRDDSLDWFVHHVALGGVACLNLNHTDASFSPGTPAFQNPPLTSSLIQLETNTVVNANGQDYIAYCFAEKKGFSKFGSYTGNGNADGTFVYTGFKPAFILIKQTNATGSWYMWDNKRDTFNPYQKYVSPNNSNTEYTSSERWLDSLSNGFKWRNTETAMNGSGASYIYMAFAEAPLVGSNNIPCTAR